ncbi:hypothetical protein BC936DRAFT_137851 [Jimgerdemannia flammicorona]|uniref:Uncharacterized protein n=1 Tax=Jimgerdemannia flammicorona TaxID=994334 RepID=A0A433CWI5_9FUNG|nr:hypothetical protein BC936DRAFT_137851 [Jimgerdemannia flammicorona]
MVPTSSSDIWLPSWTINTLGDRRFYHFEHSTQKSKSPLSRDAKDFLASINTNKIDELDNAGFIVVDNYAIDPTDTEYLELLSNAEELQIPILSASDIEFVRRAHFDDVLQELEVTDNPTSIKNVEEEGESDELQLTFDGECSDVPIEELHHEILLRDPIVRGFVQNPRKDLESLVIQTPGPPRIVGTRWTIEDAQNDYIAEAWRSIDSKTWRRQWSPEEFNRDYMGPKGRAATDVVYAALWMFFDENREAVESRIPSKASIPSEALIFRQSPSEPVQKLYDENFFPHEAKHMYDMYLHMCAMYLHTYACGRSLSSESVDCSELADSGFGSGTPDASTILSRIQEYAFTL